MAEDLIRELKEDIEREKWQRLWQRYGSALITVAALLVAAAGAHAWWKQHQMSLQETAGGLFQTAFSEAGDGKWKEAAGHFAELRAGKAEGYAALGALQEAAALEKLGKQKEAYDAYRKLAQDKSADIYVRNMAAIALASKLSADEAVPLLDAIIAARGPLWPQALEIRAGKFLDAGKQDMAKADLETLSKEAGVPETARMRATRALMQINGTPK
ncbi:MAG: tetratricopeptide repeat protein [Alphaproteobacteria bacterium]|nr:tetratricopeptide repeat protein [Alphaproteobacteria bacterium]